MQLQSVHIAYTIINSTGNFELVIRKWNLMPTVQKTWLGFKQFFWTAYHEFREITDLTVQDAGMHYAKRVCNVVA